jgi:hypothetical protein
MYVGLWEQYQQTETRFMMKVTEESIMETSHLVPKFNIPYNFWNAAYKDTRNNSAIFG